MNYCSMTPGSKSHTRRIHIAVDCNIPGFKVSIQAMESVLHCMHWLPRCLYNGHDLFIYDPWKSVGLIHFDVNKESPVTSLDSNPHCRLWKLHCTACTGCHGAYIMDNHQRTLHNYSGHSHNYTTVCKIPISTFWLPSLVLRCSMYKGAL